MVDILTPEQRHRCMSAIRNKNTSPELFLRSALHKAGLRYRLHDKKLPGSPDIVFPKYHAVLFVHGCYWHSHGCYKSTTPKTRRHFWIKKLTANRERDAHNIELLHEKGWRIMIVWECALKGKTSLSNRTVAENIKAWLHSSMPFGEIPPHTASNVLRVV